MAKMETQPNSQALLPIRVVGSASTIDSLTVADGLGIQHKNLLETIRTHQAAIEADFGPIAFETEPVKREGHRGTKYARVAYLTEDQTLFVGTLSRNSQRVVAFKALLIKSFAAIRHRLSEPSAPDPVLLQVVNVLASTQEALAQLQVEVNNLRTNQQLGMGTSIDSRAGGRQLALPGIPPPASRIRKLIRQRIDEYCARWDYNQQDTWAHLYRRFFDVYNVNVHRFKMLDGESKLAAIERYGRLQDFYRLVLRELGNA